MNNERIYKRYYERAGIWNYITKTLKISPLMLALVPYAIGIALGRYFAFNNYFLLSFFALSILCFIATFLTRRTFLVGIGFTLLLIPLGYLNIKFYYNRVFSYNKELYEMSLEQEFKLYEMTGQIRKSPIPGGNGTKTFIEVMELHEEGKSKKISGKLSVFIKGTDYKDLRPGDIIKFKTTLKPVRNYKTDGSFDFETWRISVGIMVSGFISDKNPITKIDHKIHTDKLPLPLYITENMRWHLIQKIESYFDEKTRGIALGLLIGEKTWIDKGVIEAFQNTGTMHLLAISGLHMGLMVFFFGGAVYLILLRITWLSERFIVRKFAIVIALLAGTLYTALAGFSPSAVRSIIMLYALSIPFVINRSQTTMNSLAIAGWIILLLYPIDLYSLSFQLSFVSVFFLILFLGSSIESITRESSETNKSLASVIRSRIIDIIKPTIVCTFALSPILAWYFQKLTPLSVPSNLIAVPLSNFLIMPELLLGAMLLPISETLSHIVWIIPKYFIEVLIDFVTFMSKLPYASIMTVRPTLIQVFFAYIVIFFMIYFYAMKRNFWISVFVGLLLVSPINQVYYNPFEKPGLVVYTLDVGHGNCHVIRLPDKKLMVINAGGPYTPTFDIGERVIAPFIRSIGYTHIDVLAFSNPEVENTGGMPFLVRSFDVKEIWSNGDVSKKEHFTEFMRIVKEKNINHRVIKKDEIITFDHGVMIKAITADDCKECYSETSRSLVFYINYRERGILFTGDIDAKREKYLTRQDIGHVDVMTVPQFGASSSSSETFLQEMKPKLAILSVGWRNRNFPKEETLIRYEKINSLLIRTDYNGTITTRIHGGEIFYNAYRKKEVKLI